MTAQAQDPRLDGKVCLITGATGGIGQETAKALARRGATLVLSGRDGSTMRCCICWRSWPGVC